MENTRDLDQKPLIVSELTRGKELLNQLRIYLDPSSSTGEFLIEKILSSVNKALLILNSNVSETEIQPTGPISGILDSPRSINGSPQSDDSNRRDMYKKRKTLPRWTEQVRVCSGTGLEGPLEDGYSWRKYGQKDILGAKYPRGYYRCTHRNAQDCNATKQVQRSEDDPSIFEVTYRGKHTCISASRLAQGLPPQDKQKQNPNQQEQQRQKESQEILLNLKSGLKVKTEGLDTRELTSPSFSFPSTSIECIKTENEIFSSLTLDNNLIGNFSSPFISPTTSESNYFSPCRMNSFGGTPNLQSLDSDLNEIISAATSSSNSPTLDLDFSLDPIEFDPNFPFDSLSMFN